MNPYSRQLIGALAALGAVALLAGPTSAHQSGQGMGMMGQGMMMPQQPAAEQDSGGDKVQQRPGPGYGPGMMQGMGQGYGYGPGAGMMGPGMMSPGMMGPGMMSPGMMGPGMMSRGMMGPGMMGPGGGYGYGPGMMQGMGPAYGYGYGYHSGPNMGMGYGPCWQQRKAALEDDLEPDEVRARMERWLEIQGNDRLKLGTVEAVDEDTITVEIVTVDDSLVRKLAVDRHTGWMRPAE